MSNYTAFELACRVAAPFRDKLDWDTLDALIGAVERVITETKDPPIFMTQEQAARYVRERFGILLTAKGPPVRRLGKRTVYARDDLDKWALSKVMALPLRESG
jgi:hypothetical protein